MSSLALDIGSYSIKAVSGKIGRQIQIQRVLEIANQVGVALPNDDTVMEKMATLLDSMFNDYELPKDDVRLSLPEPVVSTKVIAIPPLSDAELASAIGWQAEQHIPIPLEELALEYQVLYRPPRREKTPMRVLLIGTRKKLVENYVDMFHAIGIEPTLLETQLLSIIRSLGFTPEDPTTMIAHLGATGMDISVVNGGEIEFVVSNMNGGRLLSRSLEHGLGLDQAQAEQYKRAYGLDMSQFEGKVSQALLPAVKIMIGELRKAISFFANKNAQAQVQRIVLSGGSALLPGLIQLMTNELGIEVLVSSPFSIANGEIPENINHPSMTVCMGLMQAEL